MNPYMISYKNSDSHSILFGLILIWYTKKSNINIKKEHWVAIHLHPITPISIMAKMNVLFRYFLSSSFLSHWLTVCPSQGVNLPIQYLEAIFFLFLFYNVKAACDLWKRNVRRSQVKMQKSSLSTSTQPIISV